MSIDANQLTTHVCDKFISKIVNLKTNEIKQISKTIINRIRESSTESEQKIRCKQALAFVDRLTIVDDPIWIYYYHEIVYASYENARHHAYKSEDHKKQWFSKAKDKYVYMMSLSFLNDENNQSNRMWIMIAFTHLCNLCWKSIDSETLNLAHKWINEVKSIDKGMLSERELNRCKMMIEKCEIDLEMCQLAIKWSVLGEYEMNRYCDEQMEKLSNAAETRNELNAKQLRRIYQAFGIRLCRFGDAQSIDKGAFCVEILNRLDRIRYAHEINAFLFYQTIVNDSYSALEQIVSDVEMRQGLATRMQTKYRQSIELSRHIFGNELNHPYRIEIIDYFIGFCQFQFRNDIDTTECVEYVHSIMSAALSQSKGALSDFEFEEAQSRLERIQHRLKQYEIE